MATSAPVRCRCAFHRSSDGTPFPALPAALLIRDRSGVCQAALLVATHAPTVAVVSGSSVATLTAEQVKERFEFCLEDALVHTSCGVMTLRDAVAACPPPSAALEAPPPPVSGFMHVCKRKWEDAMRQRVTPPSTRPGPQPRALPDPLSRASPVDLPPPRGASGDATTSPASACALQPRDSIIDFLRRPNRAATLHLEPELAEIVSVDPPMQNVRGVVLQLPVYTCVFVTARVRRRERLTSPYLSPNPRYRDVLRRFQERNPTRHVTFSGTSQEDDPDGPGA